MTVERIRNLDIKNREMFTGIYGMSATNEPYIEANLCRYHLWQELYRYLHEEGYVAIFYNPTYNFFSYRLRDLEIFLGKVLYEMPLEEALSQRADNAPIRHPRCRGPLGLVSSSRQRLALPTTRSRSNVTDNSTPYPDIIRGGSKEVGLFYQQKRGNRVFDLIFNFVDKCKKFQLAVVFTTPGETNIDNTGHVITELQARYGGQSITDMPLRILSLYHAQNAAQLLQDFNGYSGCFLYNKYFRNFIFPSPNGDQSATIDDRYLFNVSFPAQDEVGNVLKRRRVLEGLNYTLAPIPFDIVCMRLWQQFRYKDSKTGKERDVNTVKDLISIPVKDLECHLQKMDNEKAIDRLKKLRGIEGVIIQFERYLEDLRFCRENGERFRPHMAFIGNPGTGKTTVARLFADILREEGLLENGRLHQVTVGDLVSQYRGHTRIKTQEVCQKARGGVLFIDEAYGLFQRGNADTGTESGSNQLGKEAIEVLLQFMENDDKSLVILAGYPTEMDDLLKHGNVGFDSRIGKQGHFKFEDYKPDVLLEIALAQLKGRSYTEQFKQKLYAIFAVLHRFKDKNWANARTAENTISSIKSNYRVKRLKGAYDVNSIPDDYMRLIRVLTPEEEKNITKELDDMIGLDKVKTELHNIFDGVSSSRILFEKLGTFDQDMPDLSFVFEGNPGTGKTTVARLMGKILAGYGLLQDPEVKEYDKASIVSSVRGGSVKLVNQMFDDCIGKVLFIDEAYRLASQDGKEAIDQIVQNMTLPQYQGKMAIILAGYPGDMAELMNINDGIERRFSFRLRFEDYTNEQLTQMYKHYIAKMELKLADGCEEKILAWFKSKKRGKHFANGGLIKILHKDIKSLMGQRFRKNPEVTEKSFFITIIPDDIPDANRRTRKTGRTLSASWKELNELKGIDAIRTQFQEYVEWSHYCLDNPYSPVSKSFRPHMSFLGNPGTGKSTVARLFGKILQEEGLLLNNNFVEVSPEALIAEYVGQTAPKAQKEFERARGGVLFIDEAYELFKKGKEGGGNQFGQEAITALIKFMEDDRDTIIILAGYTDEIRYLIKYGNPGLQSRVTNEFIFEDYTPDILFDILLQKLYGHEVSDDFNTSMRHIINYEYEHRNREWGNARTIENYYTEIFRNYLVKHHAEGVIDTDCIPDSLMKDLRQQLSHKVDRMLRGVECTKNEMDSPSSLRIDLTTNPSDRKVADTTMLKERATGLLKSSSGEGTGFIISIPDRYVLTCSHVVEDADGIISFVMNCNKVFETHAHVVWKNHTQDMALLQLDELPEDACFIQLDNAIDSQPQELTELVLCAYPDGSDFASTPSLISGSINNYEKQHNWNDHCFDTIYANVSATYGCSGGPVVRKNDMVLVGILQGGKEGGEIQFITDIHQLFKSIDIKS